MQQVATAPAQSAPAESELAFDRLYRDSRDDVFAYVAGLLRDRSAAEDVTAQAFEARLSQAPQLRPSPRQRARLGFGIARNAALDELRRRKRITELAADPEDVDAAGAHELAESAVRRTALREAMRALGPRDRELVALKFFAGLSNAEIASVIGTSESNSRHPAAPNPDQAEEGMR